MNTAAALSMGTDMNGRDMAGPGVYTRRLVHIYMYIKHCSHRRPKWRLLQIAMCTLHMGQVNGIFLLSLFHAVSFQWKLSYEMASMYSTASSSNRHRFGRGSLPFRWLFFNRKILGQRGFSANIEKNDAERRINLRIDNCISNTERKSEFSSCFLIGWMLLTEGYLITPKQTSKVDFARVHPLYSR